MQQLAGKLAKKTLTLDEKIKFLDFAKKKIIKEQLQNSDFDDFSASDGWLDCWNTTYSVKERRIVGEARDVSTEKVTSWMERRNKLIEGYSLEKIWHMDKTSCFLKALPDKGLVEKRKQAKGGKKFKQQLAVFFFLSMQLGKRSTNPLSSGRVNSHAISRNFRTRHAQLMLTIFRILNLV